ncbi:MAG: YMGG-like glycine zipper-containing protein [Stellaceae bacterium]
MKHLGLWTAAGLAALSLSACVGPVGPTVPVAPGAGKPFPAFAADQATCEQYATAQVGPEAAYANNRAIGSAILGTALGAGLGAAVGGGHGAAIGAASGAVLGTAAGASGAGYAQMSVQRRYNLAYAQCMYAHGNRVPGFSPPPGGTYGEEGPPPGGPPYGGPPSYGPQSYGPPGPPPGWAPPPPP